MHRALGDVASAAPLGAAKMPWEHLAVSTGARTGAAPSADLTSDETEGLGLLDADGLDVAEETDATADREAWAEPSLEVDGGRRIRVLSQVHEAYILVEAPDALLIVDQHSAHERILFERTMRTLESGTESAQKLLFPLTLEFTAGELDAIEAHGELLSKLGWELEPFGGRTIAVHAVPAPHARFDAGRCLKDVVADLAGGRFGGLANPLERFASTFACRAAIKAGQALTAQEMEELVDRLFRAELPAHDVHGRPTIVQLPLGELERRFGRR